MKSLFFCFFLLSTVLTVNAQDTQSQNLGDFSKIKVYDRLRVQLIASEENKIELTGSNLEDVNLVNKNGLLKVKMKAGKMLSGENTYLKIYYSILEVIDANEGSEVKVQDTIINDIELRVQEGAAITESLKLKKANLRAVSGGILILDGSADYQEVKISTGGIYRGKSLTTAVSEIRVQAGGEVEAYATELAKLTVRAGGTIYMYGDPRNVEETKFLNGTIKIMP